MSDLILTPKLYSIELDRNTTRYVYWNNPRDCYKWVSQESLIRRSVFGFTLIII